MPRVPRILSGRELASLSLSSDETFLVSQIDAVTTEPELAVITGIPPQQLAATLDRLASAGIVAFSMQSPAETPTARPPAPSSSGLPYDPAELDEPVELDLDKKRRILEVYYRLDAMTYYELLGLDERADKKQVKAAYYAVAPEFHPDKYFRKNLGSFKAKIEALFARYTLAHDVLANAQRRAEYDEYLAQTQQNRAMSAKLEQTTQDLAAVEAVVRKAAEAVTRPSGQYAAFAPQESAPPARPSAPQTLSPEEALRLRREALARKLTGGQRRPAPTPAVRPPAARPGEVDPEVAARAAEALRLRREQAIAEAKRTQLRRYLDTGKAALDTKDYAGAANAYRIAASLEPDDPAVQATCTEAMRLAAAALSDGYWKQAVYEESQERWAEAALSYAKVCAGRPEDATAHERVAYTTIRAGTNLRRAVEFARKAVEIAPKSPEMRITLARAYHAAGLEKSCNGELDRAVELAPGNPRVACLVAQVRGLAPAAPKDATKDGKVS